MIVQLLNPANELLFIQPIEVNTTYYSTVSPYSVVVELLNKKKRKTKQNNKMCLNVVKNKIYL